MLRFSSKAKTKQTPYDYYLMHILIMECKSALLRDSYLNPNISKKPMFINQYHPLFEKPPRHIINLNFLYE